MNNFAAACFVQNNTHQQIVKGVRGKSKVRWTPELTEQLRQYMKAGTPNEEIAEALGLRYEQIRSARAREQQRSRGSLPATGARVQHDPQKIRKLKSLGMTYAQICKRMKCGCATVKRALKDAAN